uniref:Uncharacterized protein n=1 Tax=Aegilops tauschii subsp. strangulata TaxID=200361 RepID=A0A453LAW4_AEGTS
MEATAAASLARTLASSPLPCGSRRSHVRVAVAPEQRRRVRTVLAFSDHRRLLDKLVLYGLVELKVNGDGFGHCLINFIELVNTIDLCGNRWSIRAICTRSRAHQFMLEP